MQATLSPVSRATARLVACAALAAAGLVAAPVARGAADLSAYRGAGTWIDVYDAGVRTVYVESANYTTPRRGKIVYRSETARLIDSAHAAGIRVVAWYLPGLRNLHRDLRRSLGAVGFTTPGGQRFDSLALDIESSAVGSITRRNRALLRLSFRIRRSVGPNYPLGAIVPDSRSTSLFLPSLWPGFPYTELRPFYDVFIPMAYSTNRGRGARFVYRYTLDNVQYLRFATGDPLLPVHVIGGIANGLGASEDRAVVRAAGDAGAIGASFYKLRWSSRGEWRALRSLP